MTTPQAPPQQQPPQAAPPPSGMAAGLQVAVAGELLTAVSAAAALEAIRARYALSRDAQRALGAALGIAMQNPPQVTGVTGPASAAVSRQNLARRSAWVTAAAGRLTRTAAALLDATGQPVPGYQRLLAGPDPLAAERRFYAQHTAAMWQRAVAAGKTDMARLEHGDLLGWNTVRDARASPECRAADGANFRASDMPAIGYPGAVHPHCRCWAGAPHATTRMLAGYRAVPGRRAA